MSKSGEEKGGSYYEAPEKQGGTLRRTLKRYYETYETKKCRPIDKVVL